MIIIEKPTQCAKNRNRVAISGLYPYITACVSLGAIFTPLRHKADPEQTFDLFMIHTNPKQMSENLIMPS